MIQTHSKRILSPYTGLVQVAESERARALSIEGKDWEIQFRFDEGCIGSRLETGHKQKRHYVRVANVTETGVERFKLPYPVDRDLVEEQIQALAEFLEAAELPFPPADHYEYWLLDEKNQDPLALIYSCVHEEEMAMYPRHLEWTVTPASVSAVEKMPDELKVYTPPVNYQLGQLVNERAGNKPRTAWMKRRAGLDVDFPPLLVSESWDDEAHDVLCKRFIARMAPRLLMLHGLGKDVRLRLEQQAKAYAFEVAKFFPLYPDIADPALMSSIRVEAQLRVAAGETEY